MKFILYLFFIFAIQLSGAETDLRISSNNLVATVESQSDGRALTQIYFQNDNPLQNWQFGFFMLQVFVNPKIKQQLMICELNKSHCTNLLVRQNKLSKNLNEFLTPDLSSGHVTLVQPQKAFALQRNTHYVIKILTLALPQNIAAMPQKMFLIDLSNNKLINLNVTSYTNLNYNQKEQIKQIEEHNLHNWQLSKNIVSCSPIVPIPVFTQIESGKLYKLPQSINISGHKQQTSIANLLSEALKSDFGVNAKFSSANSAQINLNVCSSKVSYCKNILRAPEGYMLKISQNSGITVYANTNAGFFYAYESLRQLWNFYGANLPQMIIYDYPKFKYRGIMLDSVRHFFTPDQVKQLIDVMAAHKLNTLHLHLADDEGWRIQLNGYPQLTEIGATRSLGKIIGPSNLVDEKYDITNLKTQSYANVNTDYTGYYTLNDIKDLIKYANLRQITIIPEIEMPGHARSLKKSLASLLFESADKSIYSTVQGYNDNVLPICDYNQNKAFTNTITNIVKQIADIFSGQQTLYAVNKEISLSADEVPDSVFSDFYACNNMPWRGLSVSERIHLFFNLLSKNLSGYKLSGWQQLVQNDDGYIDKYALSSKLSGHIWQWEPVNNKPISGIALASKLTANNYPVVVSFADYTYFDQRYTGAWSEPGLYWAANTDTNQALASASVVSQISHANNVLGLEGDLFSELIPSIDHLFYMALPKMAGLSEAAWSPDNLISWQSLAMRLGCGKTGFLKYLNQVYQVHYRGYPNGVNLEVPPHTLCQ